jgi:elongation factor G
LEGIDTRGDGQVIKAKVPLSELFGYVTSLRTITSGRGVSTITLSHYDTVPANIAEGILAKVKGKAEKV